MNTWLNENGTQIVNLAAPVEPRSFEIPFAIGSVSGGNYVDNPLAAQCPVMGVRMVEVRDKDGEIVEE